MAPKTHGMPGAERDDQTGQFATTYPDSAAVDAIADAGGAATTQEVADALGCNRETAYKKLVRLEDSSRVGSRKVGNARLWMTDSESEDGEPA
jgi:hypothetical protein